MGILEQVLAQVDAAKRTVGRNVSDLITDPALYAEKIIGHLRNQNAGVAPTIANGELTNRALSPSERAQHAMETLDFGGGLGVIKPKGGNWLSGSYGPEGALRGLKRENPAQAELATLPQAQWSPREAQNQALNNWIDQKLVKYVKNDMASEADPIRKLADAWPAEKATKLAAAEAKVAALRKKQEAQAATRGVPEEYLTRTRQEVLAAEEARDLIEANTGLHYSGVPYLAGRGSPTVQARRERTGFPDAFAKTELGQQWENTADSILGVNQVKDFQRYPNNLRQDPWLAKADPSAPVYNFSDNGYETGFAHLTDELANSLREGRLTPEQLGKMPIDQAVRHVAEVNALRDVKAKQERAMDTAGMPLHKDYPEQGLSWRQLMSDDEDQLQKWLTQEGDAMGHCVGGYCPDVMSGTSNIYSLRDAKGQPHVTIETAGPFDTQGYDAEGLPEIVQIKGKGNAKPKDEYLPFVQDFVRSGKWGDIGDAANTGLTPKEIQQLLKGQ